MRPKGLQPKTIVAYAHGMRRIGEHLGYRVDDLGEVDFDAQRMRVRQHPRLLFSNRAGGLAGARAARGPLDRSSLQRTLHQIEEST